MSKKRPSLPGGLVRRSRKGGKLDPGYWQHRLYRNTYTYKGKRCELAHWSVKIQHLGQRKTFTLRASTPPQAAMEASQLYGKILQEGWDALNVREQRRAPRSAAVQPGNAGAQHGRAAFWKERLMHRAYTFNLTPHTGRELSARISHEDVNYYFPLGTELRELAAQQALRIYQVVTACGWEIAKERFRRELNVAFRWSDSPLAWTYTTIHTRIGVTQKASTPGPDRRRGRLQVAVVESDRSIQQALGYWLNRAEEFSCGAIFASAADAVRQLRKSKPGLILVNENLADKPGQACLEDLRALAPEVAGLLYSVYEDSEELFRSTPGGAGCYMLVRTHPAHFLAPIVELVRRATFSSGQMASGAWQYFKNTMASLPVGDAGHELQHLTSREQEVLALLSQGHPDKTIADRLQISLYTVHAHVRNIFDKLGVHNRTGAVLKYFQK